MRRARKVAGGLFEQQLFAELCGAFTAGAQLPLLGLRLAVELLFYDLTYEGATLLYEQRGWTDDATFLGGRIVNLNEDFKGRLGRLTGRELGELLMALLVLTELQGLDMSAGPEVLTEHMDFTRRLAAEYAVNLDEVWASAKADAHAQVHGGGRAAGSAAGAARRELSPTEAFVQQHGAAAGGHATTTEAGDGQQDQTDEGPSDANA